MLGGLPPLLLHLVALYPLLPVFGSTTRAFLALTLALLPDGALPLLPLLARLLRVMPARVAVLTDPFSAITSAVLLLAVAVYPIAGALGVATIAIVVTTGVPTSQLLGDRALHVDDAPPLDRPSDEALDIGFLERPRDDAPSAALVPRHVAHAAPIALHALEGHVVVADARLHEVPLLDEVVVARLDPDVAHARRLPSRPRRQGRPADDAAAMPPRDP